MPCVGKLLVKKSSSILLLIADIITNNFICQVSVDTFHSVNMACLICKKNLNI